MRKLLPYEEIIAKKMEELPVPDLQDAIWSSIQANLGSPLPDLSDGGTATSQVVTVSTGKIVTGIIISVIIITITVMVANRKKKMKQQTNPIPVITLPPAPADDSSLGKGEKRITTVPYVKSDSGVTVTSPPSKDTSVLITPVFPVTHPSDSSISKIPVSPVKDTLPVLPGNQPKKKTIGVTGISDSSYKISGKKDSM